MAQPKTVGFQVRSGYRPPQDFPTRAAAERQALQLREIGELDGLYAVVLPVIPKPAGGNPCDYVRLVLPEKW